MHILSILVILFLSISSSHSFNYQRFSNNDICDVKFGILCLHDELLIVKTVAQGIIRRANDIEQNVSKTKLEYEREKYHIFQIQRTKLFETLRKKVDQEMNFTSRYSPSSFYHGESIRRNNIEKVRFQTESFVCFSSLIFSF